MRNEALNASSAKFKSRLWVDSDSSRHIYIYIYRYSMASILHNVCTSWHVDLPRSNVNVRGVSGTQSVPAHSHPATLNQGRNYLYWNGQLVWTQALGLYLWGMVVVQGVLRLAPPTRPSDERPPVMYGHFCLVPRVSVHERYYCTRIPNLRHFIQKSNPKNNPKIPIFRMVPTCQW